MSEYFLAGLKLGGALMELSVKNYNFSCHFFLRKLVFGFL